MSWTGGEQCGSRTQKIVSGNIIPKSLDTGKGVGQPKYSDANDDPDVQLLSGRASNDIVDFVNQSQWDADAAGHQSNNSPFPLPHGWVSLPPGDRIDELGDLLEWIANAKPSDGPEIYKEIDRLYIQNGDLDGAIKLGEAFLAVAKTDLTTADRQAILDKYEYLTRIDPHDAGQATINNVAMLVQLGMVPGVSGGPKSPTQTEDGAQVPDPNKPSDSWAKGWAARGNELESRYGGAEDIPSNFPTIDRFPDGIATSCKSIDLGAGTYQNPARLMGRLNAYVDKLASFIGDSWSGTTIEESEIRGRTLRLAVPKGTMTSTQSTVLDAAAARAKEIGIGFDIIHD